MVHNIQALRFFAALLVVLFHVFSIYAHYNAELLRHIANIFVPYGHIGVDIFFVISGFVIWTSTVLRHNIADIAPFAIRRFVRIFITYWPMLLFAAIIETVIRQKTILGSDLLCSVALLPMEFCVSGKILLPVSWTLTFELLFYFTFAILMFLPRMMGLVVMLIWAIVSLSPLSQGIFSSPFIAEFVAGCVLAAFIQKVKLKMSVLPVLAVLAIAFFLGGTLGEGNWWRVVCYGSASVMLVLLAVCLEEQGFIVRRGLVEWGGASYALYLCHFPILQAFAHHWQMVKVHPEWMLLPVIPLSLTMSIAWWLLIEKKTNRIIKNNINIFFSQRMKVQTAETDGGKGGGQ